MSNLRVTVWHEHRHEKKNPVVAGVYPKGIHGCIADFLTAAGGMDVRTATLDEPEHGLTDAVLNSTDVMTWWGHMAHDEVSDAVVAKVQKRVHQGMGLVVLHSAHFSKIFRRLMGTSCDLKWRESNDREILWITAPGHPIVQGISDHVIIAKEEMYGEYFDIPEPDETVMISSFQPGGEVFRSLVTYRRAAGRVVYFRPGHESFPTYHQKEIQQIITNAVRFAAPTPGSQPAIFGNRQPLP